MNARTLSSLLLAAISLLGLPPASAAGTPPTAATPATATAPRVTKEEAVAMVRKAIAQYKRDGKEKTFKAIIDRSNPTYHDRELYIWVADFNTGYTVAHGVNPRLMGKDLTYIRDADGQAFFLKLSALAKAGKSGWFSYKWPNPVTNVIEPKTAYVEPWDGYAFCAGVYESKNP